MRILLASEFYHPSIGGVQQVMRQLGERFVAHGHEVTIATSYLPERQSRTQGGVRIEEFRVAGNLVRGLTGEIDRYREYVLKSDYDVFMVKAAQQWTFDALTPILDQITKPKVFVPCGFSGLYFPEYSEYFAKMPYWLRKWDWLIFYASDYRDINLARAHGIKTFSIIPNGADEREFGTPRDTTFRERMKIPPDAFLILTVGSMTGLKGHDELARAFELSDFGNSSACLILNGNIPRPEADASARWRAKTAIGKRMAHAVALYRLGGILRVLKWMLRYLLEAIRLGWVLSWLGYPRNATTSDVVRRINSMPRRRAIVTDLQRAELIQAYLNSNLFAFASKIEYSPLVLYEAAAAGLPFLSVPVGNAEEIAEWTQGGVICPASVDERGYTQVDLDELARHISSLSSDASMLARLGAQGRRNWERRFTWDKISRMYEDVFEQCIRSKSTYVS